MRWVSQTLTPSYELTWRADRIRQLARWLQRPVGRCGAGRRSQQEDRWKISLRKLPAHRNRLRRSPVKKTRGLLAGEGDCLRPISQHLFTESRKIDGEVEGLMVHSRTGLAHIGEANAEFQQAWKFMQFILARRYADLMDRAPKAVAWMHLVVTYVG